jgi:hypothetical protein
LVQGQAATEACPPDPVAELLRLRNLHGEDDGRQRPDSLHLRITYRADILS